MNRTALPTRSTSLCCSNSSTVQGPLLVSRPSMEMMEVSSLPPEVRAPERDQGHGAFEARALEQVEREQVVRTLLAYEGNRARRAHSASPLPR